MTKSKLIFPGALKEFADQVDCPWLLMFEQDGHTTKETGVQHYRAQVMDSGEQWVLLRTRFEEFYVRMKVEQEEGSYRLYGWVLFEGSGDLHRSCALLTPPKIHSGLMCHESPQFVNEPGIWLANKFAHLKDNDET